jgi:hypothetical protein
LDDNGLTQVCRASLVLARFDQFFRAGAAVLDPLRDAIETSHGDLDALVENCTPPATRSDLMAVARATLEDHRPLAAATQLAINPTFSLSLALGGADADVVADGLLLDFKSSAGTRVVRRDELWQLVGYCLANADDHYAIRSVGLAALRWRTTCSWPVSALLAELSGVDRPLADWREEFAYVVTEPSAPSRPRRPSARSRRRSG